MTTNFEIEDNYALRHNGTLFDLHNNFCLASFQHNDQKREFRISWLRGIGDWAPLNEALGLEIVHKEVSFLNISQGEDFSTDSNNNLTDISFFPSTSRDINDSLISQSLPTEKDDLLYFFENGRLIRIGCEAVELIVNVQ